MNKRLVRALSSVAAATMLSISAQAAVVGYDIGITTFYQFGAPPDLTFADFGTGSPDTGYWRVTNSGSTTFSGTIGQVAVSNFAGDFSYSHAVVLAPGASVVFAANFESSNMGGYNGPFGSTQPGIEIFLTGLFDGTEAVDLHVFDKDIHSGVVRDANAPPSACGGAPLLTDAYVLQGGHPTGCDTADDFEVSQAAGHFSFVERVDGVPEPASVLLVGLALLALSAAARRARP